ncbi:MAG: DUF2059 domain-containing protein, partial [Algibacter sp.]
KAQDTSTALKLAKTLHSKKIEQKTRFINEIKDKKIPNETSSKAITEEDLYPKIAQAYTSLFTPEEITRMYAFYNSALGQKTAKNERQVNRDVSIIVRAWEMEQNGINREGRGNRRIVDGKGVEIDTLRARKRKEMIAKRKAERETPLPKINTLDDLKNLIEKQPRLISDRRLLLELFGEEGVKKLFNRE